MGDAQQDHQSGADFGNGFARNGHGRIADSLNDGTHGMNPRAPVVTVIPMVFELLPDVHPDLNPLMWLVGNWHGNGHVEYPEQEKQTFEQDVIFHHDSRPFLHYFSQTWLTDDDGNRIGPGEQETGFLRATGGDQIDLVLSLHTGYAHDLHGQLDGPRMTYVTKWLARPETEPDYTEQRMYGLVQGDLMYAIDRETGGHPMQSYAWGQLARV
ncbi:hypothetical protein BH09ACT10_BH09ACT10_22590 [soil metagenome]